MQAGHLFNQPIGSKRGATARGFRAVVAAVTAGAFALASLPTRARADEPPVVIDQAALGEQLFAALLQIRDGGNGGLAHLLLSAELLEWRRQHPSAGAPEVTAHFTARQQAP